MQQGDFTVRSVALTGAAATPVSANQIIANDAANPGNGKLSTAALVGFLGVTISGSDFYGYAACRIQGVVQIRVGATAIVAGNLIVSDATGNATPFTQGVLAAGQAQKQIVGIALESAAIGALVDVFIQPAFGFA